MYKAKKLLIILLSLTITLVPIMTSALSDVETQEEPLPNQEIMSEEAVDNEVGEKESFNDISETEEISEEEVLPSEEEIVQPEKEPEVSEPEISEQPESEEVPLEVKTEEDESEELPSIYFTASGGDYSVGDNVSYKAVHILPQNHGDDYMEIAYFTFPSDSDVMGTCAQLGVNFASSGTAQIDRRIANSTRLAKVVYDLVYVKKYLELPERDKTIYGVVPGVISSTVWTRGYLVECACQIDIMGRSAYLNTWGSNMSTPTPVANWYANYDVSGINVPDNFEIYYCNAGSHQNFVFWKLATNGYVQIIKEPQTAIPDACSDYYSLKDAVYYLYDSKDNAEACINKLAANPNATPPSTGRVKDTKGNYAVLTTKANGKTNVVEVPIGTYWAAEVTPSKGYLLDTTARKLTALSSNDEDNPATATSKEKPDNPEIQIHKAVVSTSSEQVRNNPLYSVEGTKFAIYYTESDAKAGTNAVKTFTIDANGNSATEKIFFGKYYIVETQAGPGYLIPSALSKANGGKQITCDTTKTINLP